MDYKDIFDKMIFNNYYTSKELMYDRNVNILLNPFDYKKFLDYKKALIDTSSYIRKLDLVSFNDAPLFYALPASLIHIAASYLKLINEDLMTSNLPIMFRNFDDMTLSRIYSEVEGTLNIESVPTTRKVVDEIASGKRDPKSLNEQIIKNMIEGIDFVNKCPDFNEDNLFELYKILSNCCLDEEDKLLDGEKYRHDGVEVGGYKGCPADKIKECMDSLFVYVNSNLKNSDLFIYLPHIAHYYIAYIHPYFDYNGRTARMVSYWVSLLMNKGYLPPVISEAINQTKNQYYASLSETRDANNDLTYFLEYIIGVSIKYFLTYKNVEALDQEMKNKSIVLSNTEKVYIKKILISNKGKFTYNDFKEWVDINMTKQGALKILNNLESYGFLNSEITKSNKKLFEVNMSMVQYAYND